MFGPKGQRKQRRGPDKIRKNRDTTKQDTIEIYHKDEDEKLLDHAVAIVERLGFKCKVIKE